MKRAVSTNDSRAARLVLNANLLIAILVITGGQPADAMIQNSPVSYAGLPAYQNVQPTMVQNEFRDLDVRLKELEREVTRIREPGQDSQPALEAQGDKGAADAAKVVGERLDKLEKSVEDIDGSFKNVVYNGYSGATMEFEGRIHLDYWAFPDVETDIFPLEGGNPQDGFEFRRLRYGVSGSVADNMEYKLDLEFADPSSPGFRDAYIGVTDLPYFNTVLIGNQKRPYGLDHLNSSKYNIFLERPLIVEAINQDARRLGIASYGFSKNQFWNWRYGVFNQQLIQGNGSYRGDHYQLEAAGRLAATPWYDETSGGRGYLHLAVAGSAGYPDGQGGSNNTARYRTRVEARTENRWIDTGTIAGADETLLGAMEAVLNLGSTQIGGEAQRVNVNRDAGFGPDLAFHGGYIYVSHFLTGEHMPWSRESGTLGRVKPLENFFSVRTCDQQVARGLGAWQVATRYSMADFRDLDIDGGVARNWTFALNWYWNPSVHWQMNYIVGEIDRGAVVGGDYQIIGTRVCIDF